MQKPSSDPVLYDSGKDARGFFVVANTPVGARLAREEFAAVLLTNRVIVLRGQASLLQKWIQRLRRITLPIE